eukprot:scaffold269531_cov19-Tisochrysis_lutea.AAC.2
MKCGRSQWFIGHTTSAAARVMELSEEDCGGQPRQKDKGGWQCCIRELAEADHPRPPHRFCALGLA